MICSYCKEEFQESELELSHDIPRYIGGTDKDGRHWLCKKHHNDYDNLILKKILNYVGEEFIEEERIGWMINLKKQSYLHSKFKEIAKQVKEEYYG